MGSVASKKKPSIVAKAKVNIEKLTKPEARVAIANDVIGQIRRNKYNAERGTYLELSPTSEVALCSNIISFEDVHEGVELQGILKDKVESCTVCAKGALFVSMIRKFDNFSVDNLSTGQFEFRGEMVTEELRRYFPAKQLELIEYAFEEGEAGDIYDGVSKQKRFNAQEFGRKFDNPEDRMIAIMKNIVKNNGEFIPPDVEYDADEDLAL